ncbi:MAG TPA: serine hydrolase domain-containing protein [Candidatus Binataceae bacterium]
MTNVGGTVEKGFEAVRDGFAQAQEKDAGGAQLCVYRKGKKVVDLWCGRDKANDRPFTADTITILMSCTKGLTATAAHMLVERGLLDVDAPVTRYWPEFDRNGKAGMPVRYLLSHRAGLMAFAPESGIGLRDFLDWNRCTAALAEMEPLWTPGTAYMYHAITYGYLVGEVIRRVAGKSVGQFFAEEIAKPLQLDLWIGLPEREEHRVAPQFNTGPELTREQMQAMMSGFGIDLNSRIIKTMLNIVVSIDELNKELDSRAGHAAEIPAGNGIGNARSLAKMYAATIGEVDGVRLLKRETIARACEPQIDGLSMPEPLSKLPAPDPMRFGLGYELNRGSVPMLGDVSFGHSGAGGRLGFAHPESGIAVGYVCNNMAWDYMRGPDDRWVPWTKALRESVGM